MMRKILSFFNAREKKKIGLLFFGIIIMGLIEMVSIAAILPFMAVIAKPEIVQTNTLLSSLSHFLGIQDIRMFTLLLGASVFFTLVLGNVFSAFTTWIMMRFSYYSGKKISCALLENYLLQPYSFFLNRNSSDLTKNILSEVDRVVQGIFINTLQSLAKGVMIICILGLLFIVEPFLALTLILSLGGAYFITYYLVRKRLHNAGKTASLMNGLRIKILNESMGAIKELKVLKREQAFIDDFDTYALKYAKAETLSQLSPMITRYVIEIIAFGGMILMVLYFLYGGNVLKFLPFLGLYALAGYRLMPAMQQMFVGVTSLKYHFSCLDNLYQEMQSMIPKKSSFPLETHLFKKTFTLKQVSFTYPNALKRALNSIHITIPKYATIGIVGSTGSGKTTLIDIILGLLTPEEGDLIIDNMVITEHNRAAWQKNIGYVPQTLFLSDASVASNIALGIPLSKIDHQAIEKAATMANLHDFIINELPAGYDTLIGERGIRLSGGQRQRIGIARALYHDPELLIFDEATSALDGMTEKIIMEAIHGLSHRKTIIIIAHRLNTVKECDVIYMLNKGEIVAQGTYQTLCESNTLFQGLVNVQVGVQST